ncbi:ion transporter [Noviherbaspirillum sp. Root189]|uniref:ion transporter n=1 Tax=Noviherbaspirillum sp. Root189 TaxID=1736487 RepID=UPI00070BC6EB|nr:ion transporter [Noviherbaspirillum sp. Root189]KRB94025.1 ion transporter [Noviherbaspirillum sp. Root189]
MNRDLPSSQPLTTAPFGRPESGWRLRLYTIIFEAETDAGRRFDKLLIVAILASIFVVLLDSVRAISIRFDVEMNVLEWGFTLLFTFEYLLRLACVKRPLRYATSFFGIIDLLSVLPTYLAFFVPEVHALLDVRILRLIRIFRIFKLTLYVQEYQVLTSAISASRRKILVFLSIVMMAVLVMGTLMYVLEGPAHGFTSIPKSMYWAIVTMTTVGYGDMTPQTDVGKALASLMMLLGWGVLAVPTGIVTAEMTTQRLSLPGSLRRSTRICASCRSEGHDDDARFCKDCGASMPAGGQQ